MNLALRCEALGISLSIATDGKLAATGPITPEIRAELMQCNTQLLAEIHWGMTHPKLWWRIRPRHAQP